MKTIKSEGILGGFNIRLFWVLTIVETVMSDGMQVCVLLAVNVHICAVC